MLARRAVRWALVLILSAAAHAQAPAPAQLMAQQAGPHPGRLVAGGGTDAMARAVADRLGPALKTPVVVENKPGASNTLAADATAKATDGHTMVMGVSTAHAIAPHLLKLGYDNNKDLVPVAFVGACRTCWSSPTACRPRRSRRLSKLAKSKPGKLNFASSGAGSTQHIAAEMFKESAGVFITHIPYRGSGPALVDLMGGQVQLSFDTMAVGAAAHQERQGARAGRVTRSAARAADVPTLTEAGVKGVEMSAWYGIYMPAATPKAVQDRVHDEVTKLLALPDTKARLAAIGAEITPMTQAQFAAFHQDREQALRRADHEARHQARLKPAQARSAAMSDLENARREYLAGGDDAMLPIVDAHHHYWDLARNPHPWLQREPRIPFRYGDYGAICRDYLPADHARDPAGHRVLRSVLMEGEWDPADPVGEARWTSALARAAARRTRSRPGMARRDDLGDVLAGLARAALVKSVRHKPRAHRARSTAATGRSRARCAARAGAPATRGSERAA